MKYKILDSTDRKFLNEIIEFDVAKKSIMLGQRKIQIDKKMHVNADIIRLSNSNYSIDIIEVK